jgi:hypothetical protein
MLPKKQFFIVFFVNKLQPTRTAIMKKFILLLIFFTCIPNIYCQEKKETLEEQFSGVIEKSNSYQDYKVVKKYKLYNLRKNVLDTIANLKLTIDNNNKRIEDQNNQITSLNNELSTTQSKLKIAKEKENGMFLFGKLVSKATYSLILFSIIGLLILGLLFLFYKYKNSHIITKSTQEKLQETEEEFEAHRQRALQREQEIRRKLQDEINKNKS